MGSSPAQCGSFRTGRRLNVSQTGHCADQVYGSPRNARAELAS